MSELQQTQDEKIKPVEKEKGLIAWFVYNPVAANLLMLIIIVGGLITATTIRKQFFPAVEINWIQFSANYPGAAPKDVEEGITMKVENALSDVQGIKRTITHSHQNGVSGYFQVGEGFEPQVVLEEIKSEIDGISTFPDAMEPAKIEQIKMKQEVLYMSLYGDLTPIQLKKIGKKVFDRLKALPNVHVSEFYSGLDYEMSIEVSKDKLRAYGISFEDVAAAIQGSSQNMSAGQIKAENGYINLRIENQSYTGSKYKSIPILTLKDGSKILLGDIANVSDGLEDGIQYSRFNGKNAVTLFVGASSDQSITDIAKIVKKFVKKEQSLMPDGVSFETWVDMTFYLDGRLDLMLNNMKSGGFLVFLILALFLRVRLAFWVMVGLPVCFLGTLFLLPLEMIDVTINVISLFAFILVLGIVVDDAIVVGESVHEECAGKPNTRERVIQGAQRVAVPVTFGVLTTIAAFLPVAMGEGPSAAFGKAIALVVILALIFSLIESKLILPSHLASMKAPTKVKKGSKNPIDWLRNGVNFLQGHVDRFLSIFIYKRYQPFLKTMVVYRYTVIVFFVGLLIACAGLYQGGLVRFVGQPKIPHDFPSVTFEMNTGSSDKATLNALLAIEDAIRKVDKNLFEKYQQTMIQDMQVSLKGPLKGEIMIKLSDPEKRALNTFEIANLWRDAFPSIAGLKSLKVNDSLLGGNRKDDGDIAFKLQSKDKEKLKLASELLFEKLSVLKGVYDVTTSHDKLSKELQFTLNPLAKSLGLTLRGVAIQVSQGFYGLEVQRFLRDGEEVKVMLRYPEAQRNSISLVSETLIRTANGTEFPLSALVDITMTKGVNNIRREGGKRTISVWASVDLAQAEPFKLTKDIKKNFLPQLLKQYPEVTTNVSGKIKEEMDGANAQERNFILAMLLIYALLAIPLKSYAQPFMIMAVIPFGVIGAIAGHLLLNIDLSMLSVFGIIAAAGVVVNDSLVMVDYINKARDKGEKLKTAVINAGCRRFRPIMLTSLTTFLGLIPIMTETSLQAKMVIPMAASLAFGVLFATVVTLILIPCLYVMIEDLKAINFRKNKVAS